MIEYLKAWIDLDGSRLPWALALIFIAWLVLVGSPYLDQWLSSRKK